ncbi:FG-GAP-like repeat-containing protein [Marininema halotolerans]|uniref:HYR domain-containing protein n=1 Tax=Marininema halotolerans TaxID=1155944 RepID=A0A1I6P9G4_9BACL|nr:FG-GAP-like repeat-containing protein [Marininema halotolerans]SFS36834.1 HYR domain-containing protein [Marininema halotolerans]
MVCPAYTSTLILDTGETNSQFLTNGDFNHNGFIDLAVSNQGAVPNGVPSSISVFYRDENGFTVPPTQLTVPTNKIAQGITSGDFNHDTYIDLALATVDAITGNDEISIYLNQAGQGFTLLNTFSTGGIGLTSPSRLGPRIVAADFNGDGNLDLAITHSVSNNFSVFLGQGNGTFVAATGSPYSVPVNNPVPIIAADIDGDGLPEVVLASETDSVVTDGAISIFKYTNGSFTQLSLFSTLGFTPLSLASGDFNLDGNMDLAVTNINSGNVVIFLGGGNGTFSNSSIIPISNVQFVTTTDVNCDGIIDLALSVEGTPNLFLLGNGDGTFTQSDIALDDTGSLEIISADFNNDGRQDVAVPNKDEGTVTINFNNCVAFTSCPDLLVDNDTGKCGATVDFSVVTQCPGLSISYFPPSGSFFPVGTTSVTAIAVGLQNNVESCTFTVTVKDTEAPVISGLKDIDVETVNPAGTIVTYPAPTVTDNCPNPTVICRPPSGSFFPLGITTVICTATDSSGNTATGSFQVDVNQMEEE